VEAFLGVDVVVVVVVAEVDLHPVDGAGEAAGSRVVVGGDSGAGLVADVGRSYVVRPGDGRSGIGNIARACR
jgi:hypothetical protein